LFKESTVKSFTSAGIDMYDKVTGKARQVGDIMKDLHIKFMQTSDDKALDDLRNQFAGSEGLNMLIQTAADKSGNFLRTLDQFDKVDFNFARALKEAKEDVTYLQQETENLLATTKIQLGEEMLPWKLNWVQFSLKFIEKVNAITNGREAMNEFSIRENIGNIREEYDGKLAGAHTMSRLDFEKNQAELAMKYQNAMTMRNAYDSDLDFQREVYGKGNYKPGDKGWEQYMKRHQSEADEYMKYIKDFPEMRANPAINPHKQNAAEVVDPNNPEGGGTNSSITAGLNDISGGGSKATSITITIQKLNENININTTTLSESTPDIENKLTEALVRAVGGAEQMLN